MSDTIPGGGEAALPAEEPPAPRRAFVAFAGGGAKGIAHVGALRALEQRQVRVLGYSGTSAGAIVAALAAAGFRADEIMHPEERQGIVSLLAKFDSGLSTAVDFFGPTSWYQIAEFRKLVRFATPRRAVVLGAAAFLVFIAAELAVAAFGPLAAILVILLSIFVCGLLALLLVKCLGGIANLQILRRATAALLNERVFPKEPTRAVIMADFDGKKRPALKIVAANISERRLELFSADTTPEVEVADAIAASICLPLIFDLWQIGDHRYVDGGIVSNLPAWPFDEERELDGDALTIAFAIGDSANQAKRRGTGRLSWLPSLIQTSMFGSAILSTRAVGRSELITLDPKIGMMDFDIEPDRARELLRTMTALARAEIDERLFRFPDAYRAACSQVVQLTELTLDRAPHALASGSRSGRVRAAVAMPPDKYPHSLRLQFGANFKEDTDQDILLPLTGSLVGVAWNEALPQFDIAPFPPDLDLLGEERRALRRRVWRELAWSLRVPIFGTDGAVKCIVTVDGSDKLNDTGETREVFEDLTDEISEIFTPVVQRLKEVSSDGST